MFPVLFYLNSIPPSLDSLLVLSLADFVLFAGHFTTTEVNDRCGTNDTHIRFGDLNRFQMDTNLGSVNRRGNKRAFYAGELHWTSCACCLSAEQIGFLAFLK